MRPSWGHLDRFSGTEPDEHNYDSGKHGLDSSGEYDVLGDVERGVPVEPIPVLGALRAIVTSEAPRLQRLNRCNDGESDVKVGSFSHLRTALVRRPITDAADDLWSDGSERAIDDESLGAV